MVMLRDVCHCPSSYSHWLKIDRRLLGALVLVVQLLCGSQTKAPLSFGGDVGNWES